MKKAFMFPGQGSQYLGMGGELFIEFRDLIEQANEILGYDVRKLSVDQNKMNDTAFTQPLVFCINAFCYLKQIQRQHLPDYLIGHSLGEYNALFASGTVSFGVALRLVQKRAQFMAELNGGEMYAVLGITKGQILDVLTKFPGVCVSNYNTSTQTVISGLPEDIRNVVDVLKKLYRCVRLDVSGAFHSRYMSKASKKFEKVVRDLQFGKIRIPVISNVHACEIPYDGIRNELIEQIISPVKFVDSVAYLIKHGVEEFVEVGEKKILTRMVAEIKRQYVP